MTAPEFPTPMYKLLAELSQDLLLPGLEHVPPNTITMLATNPRFIEAYMIGLNHEMSRELLWREFPTDQRGTYFRQFWDSRGRVPQPQDPETLKDIKPVPDWNTSNGLGQNLTGDAAKSQTVLLIRGNLLQRYPRAMIYAVKAEWSNNTALRSPTTTEKYPIFQGTLSPDITFLGFDLDPTTARGKQKPAENAPGWFFVIQQPPTEPRYGLDETEPDTLTGTWRDLSWKSVTTQSDYIQLSPLHDPKDKTQPYSNPTKSPDKDIIWGSNSAALAYITLQGPFRVAIHASDLLPPPEES